MEGLPVEMVSFPWSDLDELLVGSVAVAQRTASTTISAPEANYISQVGCIPQHDPVSLLGTTNELKKKTSSQP